MKHCALDVVNHILDQIGETSREVQVMYWDEEQRLKVVVILKERLLDLFFWERRLRRALRVIPPCLRMAYGKGVNFELIVERGRVRVEALP